MKKSILIGLLIAIAAPTWSMEDTLSLDSLGVDGESTTEESGLLDASPQVRRRKCCSNDTKFCLCCGCATVSVGGCLAAMITLFTLFPSASICDSNVQWNRMLAPCDHKDTSGVYATIECQRALLDEQNVDLQCAPMCHANRDHDELPTGYNEWVTLSDLNCTVDPQEQYAWVECPQGSWLNSIKSYFTRNNVSTCYHPTQKGIGLLLPRQYENQVVAEEIYTQIVDEGVTDHVEDVCKPTYDAWMDTDNCNNPQFDKQSDDGLLE